MKSVKELIQYYESLKIEERREQEVSSNTNQAEITPEISVEEKKDQISAQKESTKNVPKEEEKTLKPELNDSLVCYIVEEPRNINDLINLFNKTESKIESSAEEMKDNVIYQQDSFKNESEVEDNSHTQDLNDSLSFNIAEEPRNIKKPTNFYENEEGNKESNVDLDQEKKIENDVLTIENPFEKYLKKEINKAPCVEEETILPVKDLIDLFEIYGNNRTHIYRCIKRENLFVKFTNVKGLPLKRVLKAGLIRKGYFRSGPRNESCLKPSSLRCIYGVIRYELK